MTGSELIEKLTSTFLTWVSKKEVKTPLSFFFRVIAALLVVVVVALFLCDPTQRMRVYYVAVGAFFLFFMLVYVFAWRQPKNLVYGETGHRAELRLGLGTERREISAAELASLPGTAKPQSVTINGSTNR